MPRPKPIIATFVSPMNRDEVLAKKKTLSKSANFSSVHIDQDVSQNTATERGKLRPSHKKDKELKIERVFIKGRSITVNSSKYSVDSLHEYLTAPKFKWGRCVSLDFLS